MIINRCFRRRKEKEKQQINNYSNMKFRACKSWELTFEETENTCLLHIINFLIN